MVAKNEKQKYHDDMYKVQILKPPFFTPTGKLVDRREAWDKGYWIGAINLWILQDDPIPAIVYQQRSLTIGWAPGKLDASCSEQFEELDTAKDSLIDVEEEIGRKYSLEDLNYLGIKLYAGYGQDGSLRHTVNHVYFIVDNAPLEEYKLQEKEVYAMCVCPVEELIKVHSKKGYKFAVDSVLATGEKIKIEVDKDSFPENYDDYHFKMALLAKRFFEGDEFVLF